MLLIDEHPPPARSEAPHRGRHEPTPGEKAFGFAARRGLSAAPLGRTEDIHRAATEPLEAVKKLKLLIFIILLSTVS
jgi:hypothetical protein